MKHMQHVSEALREMRDELNKARDNEISMTDECLSQYITDHNDRHSWQRKDRTVNRLARAFDKMIARLDKWQAEAEVIERSCDNFYGD